MSVPDRNIRRRVRIPGEKFCQVCGDNALAHHFGALTCMSCKSFFRRNAPRSNDVRPCTKDSTCEINAKTRKICTYCRLQKCFAVGMKPDLLFDDDQKKELKEKVKRNRLERQQREEQSSRAKVDSTQPTLSRPVEAIANRDSPGGAFDSKTSKNCLTFDHSTTQASVSKDLISIASEQKKKLMTDLTLLAHDQLPSDPYMYWQLSNDERFLLMLLSAAYEDTVLSSLTDHQSSLSLEGSICDFDEFIEDCDAQVRQIVRFVQRLEDFQMLNLDDKIACFKGTIGAMLNVRYGYIFLVERNVWRMVKGELSFDAYKRLLDPYPNIEWSMLLCRELKSIAKTDTTIYAILHCIILFTPFSENVSNRQMVSTIRDKYVNLLQHYLASRFSFVYADDYMKELQRIVVEILTLNNHTREYFQEYHCKLAEHFATFDLLAELSSVDD